MNIKNHDYILLSNVIITGIMQIYYFNVIGLISVIISISYLCILLFSEYKSKIILILFVISIITGVVYYFLNPLYDKSNISIISVFPTMFLLIGIFHAITMPNIKRNCFFGVKTSLALKNDEVWKKVNNVGSIINYTMLFPLFIIIFYLNDDVKLNLSILTILSFAFLSLGIALFIEKRYKDKMNRQEMFDLQNQRKKETGG